MIKIIRWKCSEISSWRKCQFFLHCKQSKKNRIAQSKVELRTKKFEVFNEHGSFVINTWRHQLPRWLSIVQRRRELQFSSVFRCIERKMELMYLFGVSQLECVSSIVPRSSSTRFESDTFLYVPAATNRLLWIPLSVSFDFSNLWIWSHLAAIKLEKRFWMLHGKYQPS